MDLARFQGVIAIQQTIRSTCGALATVMDPIVGETSGEPHPSPARSVSLAGRLP